MFKYILFYRYLISSIIFFNIFLLYCKNKSFQNKNTFFESTAIEFVTESLINKSKVSSNKELMDVNPLDIKSVKEFFLEKNVFVNNKTCLLTSLYIFWENQVVRKFYNINDLIYQQIEKDYKNKINNISSKNNFLELSDKYTTLTWGDFLKQSDSNSIFINVRNHVKSEQIAIVEINAVLRSEVSLGSTIDFFIFFDNKNQIYNWKLTHGDYIDGVSYCK